MGRFLVLILLFAAVEGRTSDGLDCQRSIARLSHPHDRDQVRMRCFQKTFRQWTWGQCLRAARGFEYLGASQEAMAQCLFEGISKVTVERCLRATDQLQTGEARDDLLWGCLERLRLTIKPKDCLEIARKMTYPSLKSRATSYCHHEIRRAKN